MAGMFATWASLSLSPSPCRCLSRVTVSPFPSPAGFAPSSLATEGFSTCWSVITTRATTSISGSGARTPRPPRCRVSAGSSSEQWPGAEREPVLVRDRSCGRCHLLFSLAPTPAAQRAPHPCEPVRARSRHEKLRVIKVIRKGPVLACALQCY